MKNITQPDNTETGERDRNSLVPERLSFCEPSEETPFLSGENLSTTPEKPESTAPYSETKASTNRASLSDRLMRSPTFLNAGLVKGIIPTSMRRKSGQQILDFVSYKQGGESAAEPKAA
jgi:hypothetical protein